MNPEWINDREDAWMWQITDVVSAHLELEKGEGCLLFVYTRGTVTMVCINDAMRSPKTAKRWAEGVLGAMLEDLHEAFEAAYK